MGFCSSENLHLDFMFFTEQATDYGICACISSNVFCMYSGFRTWICRFSHRHGTRRFTTRRSIIVRFSAEELGAMHIMQLYTQSPSHAIRQRAHRQRALSSLNTNNLGRSNYYSPRRLFFMSHYTMLKRRRSSEHFMACSSGNNLTPGDWESWRLRPSEVHV